VCGNTADMLSQTRYAAHFDVIGDKTTHHGLFPCAPSDPSPAVTRDAPSGCC
jgi:arsenite methyltransferase